jgi:hypothetical protein
MTQSQKNKFKEHEELVGRLCNEDLDEAGLNRLSELLAEDVEAQQMYACYLDMHVAMRAHAQALDEEDFVMLEARAALDDCMSVGPDKSRADEHSSTAFNSDEKKPVSLTSVIPPFAMQWKRLGWLVQHPLAWTATAAVLLVGFFIIWSDSPVQELAESNDAAPAVAAIDSEEAWSARLRGTVGARWAGTKLELPEGELFAKGQRLELVEGLAEVCFGGGARVILQGPAIFEIRDDNSAVVSVGRYTALVPEEAAQFAIHTAAAELTAQAAEFGADVDVDGSVVTQVYDGGVEMRFGRGGTHKNSLQLAEGQGARVNAYSGRAALMQQPSGLQFVRYLPARETLINLADVVAGGDGFGKAHHRGVSLLDGRAVSDYGPPVQGDGKFHLTHGLDFVDGVFIPNGMRGPVQVDSIGRQFNEFPATAGDCWGGAIMARRPKEESSLPLIRLEYHGDNYGYVNWLHVASKSEELTPEGHGLIGMHSNSGITFDLHAIRARYPNKKIVRFRAMVGNLESKPEPFVADAWVLIDGVLRHHRQAFGREDGPETIEIPIADRDRFLVLAVTDSGGDTAYDWVAFGDAVIELMNVEVASADVDESRGVPQSKGARAVEDAGGGVAQSASATIEHVAAQRPQSRLKSVLLLATP